MVHTHSHTRVLTYNYKNTWKKSDLEDLLCAIRVPFELLWWLSSKEFACSVGDAGLIPWVRKITWSRKCNLPQYSCLENPMDRGAWWATVHGVTKSWTQLSN